jgi:hypothetical protein
MFTHSEPRRTPASLGSTASRPGGALDRWRAQPSSLPCARALASLTLLVSILVSHPAAADEPAPPTAGEALDLLRDRFRFGMEQYHSGAIDQAIATWESIYAELGAETGYRLAFNIARAYEQLAVSRSGSVAAVTDATKAAENYAAYVNETTRRREAGEQLEPLIEKQEREAKEHLASIAIEGDPRIVLRIDGGRERHASSIIWVAPGPHLVTFHPGKLEEQSVRITTAVGTVHSLVPPPPREHGPAAAPSMRFETHEERPFSKTLIFIGAGATALSVIVPIVFYANANAISDEFHAPSASPADQLRLTTDYERARSTAYASVAIPAVFGAATIALTAYWFLGVKQTRVPIRAALVPGGATVGATTRF